MAKDEKYHLDNGGYNVLQRLVDIRAENPDLVAIDPDATEERGRRPELRVGAARRVDAAGRPRLPVRRARARLPEPPQMARPARASRSPGVSLVLAMIVEVTH